MAIIKSLLDLDFYKLTMGQVVWDFYPDALAKYAFKNRTRKVRLGKYIQGADLRAELDRARNLRFQEGEIAYLRGVLIGGERVFRDDFLDFLRGLRLPEYDLRFQDGEIIIEFSGKWSEAIYWETLALAIVNELYYRALLGRRRKNGLPYARGWRNLAEKEKILRERPDIVFIEFGTRRRFSRRWQRRVTEFLAERLPGQLLGTSNVFLAKKIGIAPKGTVAHEWFMGIAGLHGATDEDLRAAHNLAIRQWWEAYGAKLSIALSDTFGSRFFFEDTSAEQAAGWAGLRQDSGDPFAFGEAAIRFYEKYDIDPREKLLIFSDGLDVSLIVKFHERFRGRIRTAFGWGTNLTNDLGFEPLSLVVKLAEINGRGLVKLSDNLAKATGQPEEIERYKRVFGYTNTETAECRY